MFSRIGAVAYKKDLTNTIKLCEALGNPHHRFKTIHIAGTNGKGSTSHMLAAILQEAGYKTGLYTSPHLHDFRERIKVNGDICSTSFVVDFTKRIMPLIDEIEPSFFEITVAMAFDWFAQQSVDVAVIETGLGGRLDSTNIISPILSIITNIGMDHMNMLGNTMQEIATEKAGIIKKETPVIIGETQEAIKDIFLLKAKSHEAPICFADDAYTVLQKDWNQQHLAVTVKQNANNIAHHYLLDLPGLYQTKNLLTVLTAVNQLNKIGFVINDETVHQALQHVKKMNGLHGRWEIIQQQPTIVLDVAHNEDGIRQLTAQLKLHSYHKLHIIMGMAKDKAINDVLKLMPTKAIYYFTRAQIPRALPESELAHIAASYDLMGQTYINVNDALDAAKTVAQTNDLIVVCGSVFVVGEVKR